MPVITKSEKAHGENYERKRLPGENRQSIR